MLLVSGKGVLFTKQAGIFPVLANFVLCVIELKLIAEITFN
jgi:hypothetical protein